MRLWRGRILVVRLILSLTVFSWETGEISEADPISVMYTTRRRTGNRKRTPRRKETSLLYRSSAQTPRTGGGSEELDHFNPPESHLGKLPQKMLKLEKWDSGELGIAGRRPATEAMLIGPFAVEEDSRGRLPKTVRPGGNCHYPGEIWPPKRVDASLTAAIFKISSDHARRHPHARILRRKEAPGGGKPQQTFIHKYNISKSVVSVIAVTTIMVDAILGRSVAMPCDIEPLDRDDRVHMVLWFREKGGKPLYR